MVITGSFDPDTMTVAYTDCVKSVVVYGDDGEIVSDVVEYDNGTGSIVFGDDGTFVWRDDQSDYDEVAFEWLPVQD